MSAASFDFIKEALIASGIGKGSRLSEYVSKLDVLQQKVAPFLWTVDHPGAKARMLFDWLWAEKPSRYQIRGSYKLHEVLDAQMTADAQSVGNCLGLTLLYNCLLRKVGIQAKALFIEYAFNIGPHVLTLLPTEERDIEIENILPQGFDYRGHLDNPKRTIWEDRELVADIYLSAGNEFFEKSEWSKALESCEVAIYPYPTYEKGHLNRVILLDKVEREKKIRRIS